jgi:hypothetical protein
MGEKFVTFLSMVQISENFLNFKGPVTLLRMRETYEKRMKINEIIFIRTKIL